MRSPRRRAPKPTAGARFTIQDLGHRIDLVGYIDGKEIIRGVVTAPEALDKGIELVRAGRRHALRSAFAKK